MYQISFQQINYFLVTAENLNFTQASKLLYISQPALSKQIIALENELGYPLFIRNKREVRLTAQGESLYKDWQKLKKMMDYSIENASLKGKFVNKIVNVGWIDTFDFSENLENTLRNFIEKNPEIDVNLEGYSFKALKNGLDNGKFDIVFVPFFELNSYENINWCHIEKINLSIAVPLSNPLSKLEKLSIKDLENEKFICISEDESQYGAERIKEACRYHGFEPNIKKYVPNINSLILAVQKGEGVTICHSKATAKNVKIYEYENPFNDLDLIAIWKNKNTSVVLDYFTKELMLNQKSAN